MNGRVTQLSGLLALQLLVIAGVLVTGAGLGDAEQRPLLQFDPHVVDTFRVEVDDDAVVMTRQDGGWRLDNGHPAQSDKVEKVLERLADLPAVWPVATSASAVERFEVAEKKHQRHLVLAAGDDTVAELYLGTSPGYRRVHARRGDDDAVYSVELANYELPVKPGDWLDKTLLQPRGDITAVSRGDAWRLSRGEEGWILDGEAADQEAADRLATRLRELRVTGLAEAPPDESALTAELSISDGEGDYSLTIFGDGDAADYVVASGRRDGYFRLASYVADQLVVERESLLPEEEAVAAEASAGDPAADQTAEQQAP